MLILIQDRDASVHQLGRKASLGGRRLGKSIDEVGASAECIRLERRSEVGEQSCLLGTTCVSGFEGFAPENVQSLDLFGTKIDRLDDVALLPPLDDNAYGCRPGLLRAPGWRRSLWLFCPERTHKRSKSQENEPCKYRNEPGGDRK